jgi:hypothetical protein
MLESLGEATDLFQIMELWEGVFHCQPGEDDRGSVLDMQCAFACRVHNELFPLNLEFMDDLVNAGENPFSCGIPARSYGVPWDVVDPDWLPDEYKPLADVLVRCGEIMSDECDVDLVWPDDGYEQLSTLDAPLDGLSIAYRCVMREDDSIFLSCSEDDDWWMFTWTVEDIQQLTVLYEQVRSKVAQLESYLVWFGETPDAAERVEKILLSLCSSEDEEVGDV